MARIGINRTNGAVLTGWDHCAQSIGDIVSTMVGERVTRRDIGYDGPPIQDAPSAAGPIVLHFAAIAKALRLYEPGFRLRRCHVVQVGADGVSGFALSGDFYPNGHLGDYSVVETGRDLLVPLAAGGALA